MMEGTLAGSAPASTRWLVMSPQRAVLASVLSGALLACALPTVNGWLLAWIGLVPMMWAASKAPTTRRALGLGFLSGLVFSAFAFYWLFFAVRSYLGASPVVASALFALLLAWQALLFGVFGALLRMLHAHTQLPFALLAPVTLSALEFLMPNVVPWRFAMLQAWVLPIVQIAEITGPLGVTFCLAMVNGAFVDVLLAHQERRPLPIRTIAATAVGMGLVLGFGLVRMREVDGRWAAAPKLSVGIVQTNLRAEDRPQVDHAGSIAPETARKLHETASRTLVWSTAELAAKGAKLVVWPETAFPGVGSLQKDSATVRLPSLHGLLRAPVLTGAVTEDAKVEGHFRNSAFLLSAEGKASGRYDKNALFALSERLPLANSLPFLKRLLPSGIGAYEPGEGVTTFELADARAPDGAWKLGPMICLEDLLPQHARAVSQQKPHLLVAMGNDAWFGAKSEAWGHLAGAVFRAVEQRTGLVRASQSGVSAMIDATGRVKRHLAPVVPGLNEQIPAGLLVEEVSMLEAGHTVYATLGSLWGFADLLGVLSLGMLSAALVFVVAGRERARIALVRGGLHT